MLGLTGDHQGVVRLGHRRADLHPSPVSVGAHRVAVLIGATQTRDSHGIKERLNHADVGVEVGELLDQDRLLFLRSGKGLIFGQLDLVKDRVDDRLITGIGVRGQKDGLQGRWPEDQGLGVKVQGDLFFVSRPVAPRDDPRSQCSPSHGHHRLGLKNLLVQHLQVKVVLFRRGDGLV